MSPVDSALRPEHDRRLVISPSAKARLELARDALLELPASAEAVIVASSLEAANHLARAVALRRSATYGTTRTTVSLYVGALARRGLASAGRVAASRLTLEAVATRLAQSRPRGADLGRFAPVAGTPGFARALAQTLDELRREGLVPADPALASLLAAYERSLDELGLADARDVYDAAAAELARPSPRPALVVLLDATLATRCEERWLASLGHACPRLLVTLPEGDLRSRALVERALPSTTLTAASAQGPLEPLKRALFGERAEQAAEAEGAAAHVRLQSAPGESRECVEIARAALERARGGVPFDRMAILLRAPESYVTHVVEALRRARVPVHFARGLRLPDPSGRALLALLACAAEGLSASRFAEYVSLGEVPRRDENTVHPRVGADTYAPADDDEAEAALARLDGEALIAEARSEAEEDTGTLRAPYRWERLVVEASVIGGKDRWERRLGGLREALRHSHALYTHEGDPRADQAARDLASLGELEAFALPLLDELQRLSVPASWPEWLARLTALAERALRRPERVFSVLSELSPLDSDATVSLAEVRSVLEPRLAEARQATRGRRLGKLFVGGIEDARGLSFDTVFVPGLVEKSFPKKVLEDPLFLDDARAASSPELRTNAERSQHERLMLRVASGAAEELLVYSYPRVDAEAGRPRTPSFYGLEILRVVHGALPTYEALRRMADTSSRARLGWPAPERPDDAIDDAEHDLSVLAGLLYDDERKHVGAARFLLGANPHLQRALRARAHRWRRGPYVEWDGLVNVPPGARAALDAHALSARSFSPTALQNFAACPYRFYLSALLKLSKREEPAPLEELDPLQRGTLVHETQFALLTRLRAQGLLPVRASNLSRAQDMLESTLMEVAGAHEDRLCPAIPKVWEDGIAQVRADLREWLRRMPAETSWTPSHFELSFGLVEHDDGRDAASVKEPVELECGLRLRGSIDLVETHADGRLRATDHKTGKVRAEPGSVVSGGEILQPVLYALAIERILPGEVTSGRLYYCTSTGDYTAIDVPLNDAARAAAQTVATAVGHALSVGMLPAAPKERSCTYCDFLDVCGPYEPARVRLKRDKKALPLLTAVRELP
ncbi:MAG: PD-(D/E)XK nuclease family protein [Myxococcales bacterium]|nr:PD-(D/E)XK nuclease family protein [Myxococcales bacterium]MBL0197899.1 PD-(D/E)XK nuclease family protein [Myxococcales bacterium]HQY60960.1 PD-(D/E)XK nuclease family protein [Polyangiaceae bacterium]